MRISTGIPIFRLAMGTFLLATLNEVSAQTWIQTSAPTNAWRSVAVSADGMRMVAVASGSSISTPSSIYVSTNSGTTWDEKLSQPNSFSNQWTSVASSADGLRLITGGGTPKGLILTSTNGGSSWSTNSVPLANWGSVASSADGSRLFADNFTGPFFLSTDSGGIWTSNSTPVDTAVVGCSPDGRTVIAGGFHKICISTNGALTWRTNVLPIASPAAIACSVDGERIWVGDGAGSAYGQIYRSMDSGTTWETNGSPSGSWRSIACSADGSKLVAASWISSYPFGSIYTSVDSGSTWVSNNISIKSWGEVACSADGNTLVAVATQGGPMDNRGEIWTYRRIESPRLNIAGSTDRVAVSWTIPSTISILQENSDLNQAAWTNVTNLPVLNLTNLQNEIILQQTANRFFRLKGP